MVEHWDREQTEPMHTVIQPLDDVADAPNNKLNALMFLLWSIFMMALGFMVAIMVQGHIVFR